MGGWLCALPLDHVVETMRPLPTEALPGAPGFVRGLSTIRGVPVPVVDTAALLQAEGAPDVARFVSVKTGARQVALAVGEVVGVRDLPAATVREFPPLLGQAGAGMVSAIGALDSALLLVLETARIVPEAVWAALDSRSSR